MDESRVRSWMDEFWTTPSIVLSALESQKQSERDQAQRRLEAMGTAAKQLELDTMAEFIDALARSLAVAEAEPLLIEDAVQTLEDALVSLDIGEPLDTNELTKHTGVLLDMLRRHEPASDIELTNVPSPVNSAPSSLKTAQTDASHEPATAPQPPPRPVPPLSEPRRQPPHDTEPLIWGPWKPSYPDMVDDYFEEMQTHIDNLQGGLVQLVEGELDPDLVNGLFRSSHSIKGQSAQMNAQPLSQIAHQLEDVLAAVREGTLQLGPSQVQHLLGVVDLLDEMIGQLQESGNIEVEAAPHTQAMTAILKGEPVVSAGREKQRPAQSTAAATPNDQHTVPASSPAASTAVRNAPPTSTPPSHQNAQPPEKKSPAKPAANGSSKQRNTAGRKQGQYLRVDFNKIDKTLGRIGDLFLNKLQLRELLASVEEVQLEITRLRNILMRSTRESDETLRLSPDDADALQEILGRLEARLDGTSEQMTEVVSDADMISSDLRDQVMEMRLVPIDTVLGRLGRVLFDAVQRENRGHGPGYKQAKLEVVGADTELDKRLANMLEVPLVHIVRNAIAHGIEPSKDRVAEGKSPEGHVKVEAFQQAGRVFLRVTDDGGGMDPELIGSVAIQKGIVSQEQLDGMSERDKLGLIFRPGFTTAEKADDLKGRGVGLDEVMEKIRAVKGEVLVESTEGKGSTVTLSLPLTLAIATVVVGEVAGETLAIPMSSVERVIDIDERDIESMGAPEVFSLMGKTLPLVRLDELLGLGRSPAERPDVCHGVLVEAAGQRVALVVDRTRGQREVVIKGFGSLLAQVPLMSGTTIFGDRCVLVLSPHDVVQEVTKQGTAKAGGTSSTGGQGHVREKKALVIDDDSLARVALRRIFEQAGLSVQEAADGVEGLAAAQATRFDIISTDVVMPRMDGYELTSRLRELPAYESTPIVMISSKGEEVDKRAGFDAGVDHYVTKPFDRGELIRLVKSVVD